MKKLTTLFSVLALAFAASVANADTLNVPGSGTFGDPQINFAFPSEIASINSVTVDLLYPDAATQAAPRPLVLIAGPSAAQFIMVDNTQGALDGGTYNFVLSGGGLPLVGTNPSSAGTYNFVNANLASTQLTGWNVQFRGVAAGSSYSDISIDFTRAIPEPSSALIMLGVAGLAIVRRRR